MDLVDKLKDMLPAFKASGKEHSEQITIDGIIGKLVSNPKGEVNIWVNFQNHDYGVVFNDEKTKKAFDTLINKYCYKLLVTSQESFTYEAIILEGRTPAGMAAAQFFTTGPIDDDFRAKFAKELLQFYQQNYDKRFEERF
jgi:hypothetical protein